LGGNLIAVDQGLIAENVNPFDWVSQPLLDVFNHDINGEMFLLTRLLRPAPTEEYLVSKSIGRIFRRLQQLGLSLGPPSRLRSRATGRRTRWKWVTRLAYCILVETVCRARQQQNKCNDGE